MPSVKKSKQVKEELRKKARDEITKKPNKSLELKKKSTPKKEYHHEYKRLMKIFIEASKVINSDTMSDVKMAKDDVVHHLSLKLDKSYAYSFIYIRQLALTLRKAINHTNKSAVYSIYNWQYLNNLELWTDFLVENASKHELIAGLIHPLVEIIVGVVRFRPSARYLPIRFHCLRLLNQITAGTKTLTPLLVNVMEIFNCVDFHQNCKNESKSTMNLMVMLHFSTSQLGTFEHLEITLDQIFQMVVENVHMFATDVTFPEYTTFLLITLKNFTKKCKIPAFRNAIRSLTNKIIEHCDFVKSQRLLHPYSAVIEKNVVFEKFVENYRIARLNELEKVMEATKHNSFMQPHEDYQDQERDLDQEEKDDGNESSDLDEDEFDGGEDECDSAVELEDD